MKGMKIVTLALVLLVLVYAVHAAEETQTDKLTEIMKRGKMVIAIQPDFPPFSVLKKEVTRTADTKCFSNEHAAELTGFEADVAAEAARRLGVEPCFVNPAWSEIINGTWADRWDIAFDSVSVTYERMEFLYFAKPYRTGPSAFFVHKDNKTFKQAADLSGKKIGSCAGSIQDRYMEGTLELPGQKLEYPVKNPVIVAYDKQMSSLKELALGDGVKTDAVLISIFIGNKAASEGMPVRQLGAPVVSPHVAPAIDKKQNRDPIPFVKKINEIITQMHADGTVSEIGEKYFHLETDIITPAKEFNIDSLKQYP